MHMCQCQGPHAEHQGAPNLAQRAIGCAGRSLVLASRTQFTGRCSHSTCKRPHHTISTEGGGDGSLLSVRFTSITRRAIHLAQLTFVLARLTGDTVSQRRSREALITDARDSVGVRLTPSGARRT